MTIAAMERFVSVMRECEELRAERDALKAEVERIPRNAELGRLMDRFPTCVSMEITRRDYGWLAIARELHVAFRDDLADAIRAALGHAGIEVPA